MSRQVRHRVDGRVHHSELKHMSASPAHYRYVCEEAPQGPTRPITVGSLCDRMILGGKWVMYPGKVRNGKEWDAFSKAHADYVIGIMSEVEEARGAAEAVKRDPIARKFLYGEGCEYQRVMHWDAMGLPFAAGIAGQHGRGGFDCYNPRDGWIVDLKLVSDASPEELQRNSIRQWRHTQAACYLDGARALGMDARGFVLVCVESTPPHPVTCMTVGKDVLDYGRRSLRLWCETLLRCEDEDAWPGYVQSEVAWNLPEWLTTQTAT